jgi:Protein of unknown function (DUF3307)
MSGVQGFSLVDARVQAVVSAEVSCSGGLEQLLLHAIGDYITQTEWMARRKLQHWGAALVHATVYALPFWLLSPSWAAWLTIWGTHAVIDRYSLARHLTFAKNWLTQPSLKWADCQATGYPPNVEPWKAFWLKVITDNVMHLCINYAALRWL